VQNKAAIAANVTQHEIIQETAERQRQEDQAAKQLERVKGQMAEFIYPVQMLTSIFAAAYTRAAFECGCDMATYAVEWISPPTQPYATIFNNGNPESLKRLAANPFTHTLRAEDLAQLAADPMCRDRWEELVVHTVLPPLRELVPVLQTKVRANRWLVSAKNISSTTLSIICIK
jgi:hypothetical protein